MRTITEGVAPAYVTVPPIAKEKGLFAVSLLVMVIDPLSAPTDIVFICTVKLSLPPTGIVVFSGSMIVNPEGNVGIPKVRGPVPEFVTV